MIKDIEKIYNIKVGNEKEVEFCKLIDADNDNSEHTKLEKKEALRLYAKLGSFSAVEKEMYIGWKTVKSWNDKYNSDKSSCIKKANSKGANKIRAPERRASLLALVSTVAMRSQVIARELNVTMATARNDIKYLLAKGLIKDISNNIKSNSARIVIAV